MLLANSQLIFKFQYLSGGGLSGLCVSSPSLEGSQFLSVMTRFLCQFLLWPCNYYRPPWFRLITCPISRFKLISWRRGECPSGRRLNWIHFNQKLVCWRGNSNLFWKPRFTPSVSCQPLKWVLKPSAFSRSNKSHQNCFIVQSIIESFFLGQFFLFNFGHSKLYIIRSILEFFVFLGQFL